MTLGTGRIDISATVFRILFPAIVAIRQASGQYRRRLVLGGAQ